MKTLDVLLVDNSGVCRAGTAAFEIIDGQFCHPIGDTPFRLDTGEDLVGWGDLDGPSVDIISDGGQIGWKIPRQSLIDAGVAVPDLAQQGSR